MSNNGGEMFYNPSYINKHLDAPQIVAEPDRPVRFAESFDGTWSTYPGTWSIRLSRSHSTTFGRLVRLAKLLGGTWSARPPRRVARQGLTNLDGPSKIMGLLWIPHP